MKTMYWREERVSLRVLSLLTFVALAAFAAVETFKVREQQPYFDEKMRAATIAEEALRAIKAERIRRGIPIDPDTDPAESGVMGELLSPVTTNVGYPGSKRTSINPNFAAVVVHLLREAGVADGDTVAIGLSGSFPAINAAVYAAVEALHLRPLVISSAGASQWGANHPDYMWPDMEKALQDRGVFGFRSLAMSLGGVDDRALGLSKSGRQSVRAAITRSEIPLLEAKNYADGLDQRMALFREQAGDAEIRAYVNVGGGTTSVGTRVGKQLFKAGLNTELPRGPVIDSVMARFATDGVPVIHLIRIDHLAQRFGLPVQPESVPPPGQGQVFVRIVYNRWLAGGLLLALIAAAVGLLRFDLGRRIGGRAKGPDVEQMI
jgi:poly-gamma-glutamate system protein